MPDVFAKLLLNHALTSVDEQYLKGLDTNKELRVAYDSFYPYNLN
jgi:hypothetical protein